MLLEIISRGVLLLISLINPLLTLNSIEKVDDYPLYTMHYYGDVDTNVTLTQRAITFLSRQSAQRSPLPTAAAAGAPAWGCSLFAALADPEERLYGRNFDWQFSPAVLLYYDPPDGYASVSMVDIAYWGFGPDNAGDIATLPLLKRARLIDIPAMPFDGMNEHGLAIGMAAVPGSRWPSDPARDTIGSLGIIREILDHARSVDEAVAIMAQYNIDPEGGPPVHYLIADASGASVLVEFTPDQMIVMHNDRAWDVATNFLRSAHPDNPQQRCARYRSLNAELDDHAGRITPDTAMKLLESVAQGGNYPTQWSVVYEMSRRVVHVVMGRDYATLHTFLLFE